MMFQIKTIPHRIVPPHHYFPNIYLLRKKLWVMGLSHTPSYLDLLVTRTYTANAINALIIKLTIQLT
jgi:hypothetical protein